MAKNDLRSFAKRIRVKANYVTKNSDTLTRRVALAIVQTLVAGPPGLVTPVKTGRARANWRTLLYKPGNVLYWPPNNIPGSGKPASPEEGAQRALDEAHETLGAYTGGRRSIWIANNVPYIRDLNRGTSSQAPAGFIEAAVAAGKAEIAKAKPILTEVEF